MPDSTVSRIVADLPQAGHKETCDFCGENTEGERVRYWNAETKEYEELAICYDCRWDDPKFQGKEHGN